MLAARHWMAVTPASSSAAPEHGNQREHRPGGHHEAQGARGQRGVDREQRPAVRAAVVGAGIVGLATAYELALRGATVTVYERGVPGNGQSGGESRIFRHAHDDARLVALAVEARAVWREWEERFGVELLTPVGAVAVGPPVERRLALLLEAGVRARAVDAHTVLPIMAPRDEPAMLDEDGGVIRTTAAIRALVEALGDALVWDEVVAVRPDGEVRAGGSLRRFDRVVVCAGRDTAALAGGAGLQPPVRTSTHTRFTFRGPADLACLQDHAAGAYGDPVPGGYAVGLGDEPQTTAYVAERLPGLDPRPLATRTCWVTELPAGHDAFDVWETGALRFVAGNNLFKHAPALGRRLAR
jgi:sarcosine oxidase